MSEPRVLIVDDSATIRRLVERGLKAEGLRIAGSASNGKDALVEIERLQPDVVTLDVEMPGMSGLETLKIIRKRWPRLPVIMLSSATTHGADATIEALTLGASSYVPKPSGSSSMGSADLKKVSARLSRRIRALTQNSIRGSLPAKPKGGIKRSPITQLPRPTSVRAIVMATSVGGPNALRRTLPEFVPLVRVPILITQHMPTRFTARLAKRLSQLNGVHVAEVTKMQPLEPGKAYLAPGGRHLVVRRTLTGIVADVDDGPPEAHCKPAADVLLRSAAKLFRESLLTVVLTGMGHDSVNGCRAVKKNGGTVLVQDEASSVVWGMPGLVAQAGLADAVIPLSEIPTAITRIVAPATRSHRVGT